MIVPFPRTFVARARGRDVQAVQRALRKAGFRKIPPTGIHGTVSQRNVRRFQATNGLPATGTYDVQTHRALASCFDLYGASLMAKAKAAHEKSTLARQRHARIVAAGTVLVNNAAAIHYTQGPRRMDGVTRRIHLPDFPEYADCSSAATWLPWQAGAPDPNGRGYDGYGYTGTLVINGLRVGWEISKAEAGKSSEHLDLLFYGRETTEPLGTFVHDVNGRRLRIGHVAIAISPTRAVSHGSESGPHLVEHAYRSDYVLAIRYPLVARQETG